MQTYTIEMIMNGEETQQRWSGWTEQCAIAQAFLSNAQNGARDIKVLLITEVK